VREKDGPIVVVKAIAVISLVFVRLGCAGRAPVGSRNISLLIKPAVWSSARANFQRTDSPFVLLDPWFEPNPRIAANAHRTLLRHAYVQ